jgi:signal-transduction protein with cAMP-binding, CBS, and nucleotidyltransferase domain
MTLTERIFVLRGVPGFDQLREEELLAVAASMTERRYGPAEVVVMAGASMWHLLVVVGGRIHARDSARPQPPVVGADLLLTNRSATLTLTADPQEGAVCLRMSKGHFFTVVNECPALLVEMIRLHVIGHGEEGAR